MRGKKQKRSRPDKDKRTANRGPTARRNQAARVMLMQVEEVIKIYTSLIRSRVGSDFAFVGVADEIERSMLVNMARGS